MAIYAIGDIQGCYATLERLLLDISFDPAKDRLWLVGDLVNRGPRNAEVLRRVKALGSAVQAVLGNHDLHLLARHFGVTKAKKRDTLDDILDAPDRKALVDTVLALPFLHREGNRSLVHAGFLPQWALADAQALAEEAQLSLQSSPEEFLTALVAHRGEPADSLEGAVGVLTRIRTCTAEGQLNHEFSGAPNEAPPPFRPWFELETRRTKGHTVVFGHWAALGLSLGPDWCGIDTGCVWGNQLTALRLDDAVVFQVSSKDV